MVSSNELGFDLRESSPLSHNILSRVRLATDPDVGQPVGSSSGLRGCTIASYNPKGEACHLDYHVSTGDSAKSGLGHFDKPALNYRVKCTWMNVGDLSQDVKVNVHQMPDLGVGGFIVVRRRGKLATWRREPGS